MPEKKTEEPKKKESENIVIEIKISIPPMIRTNLSETFDHLKKASEELLNVGKSVLGKKEEPKTKLKKIEVK